MEHLLRYSSSRWSLFCFCCTQVVRTRLTPKQMAELEAERNRLYRDRAVPKPKNAKRAKNAKNAKKAKEAEEAKTFLIPFCLFCLNYDRNCHLSEDFSIISWEKVVQKYFFGKLVQYKRRYFCLTYLHFHVEQLLFCAVCA